MSDRETCFVAIKHTLCIIDYCHSTSYVAISLSLLLSLSLIYEALELGFIAVRTSHIHHL